MFHNVRLFQTVSKRTNQNTVSNALDRFINVRMNKTQIRVFQGSGQAFYKARWFGRRPVLAEFMSRDIHLDSLQSDPEYIKSIHRCHSFHKPKNVEAKRRFQKLMSNHSEGMVTQSWIRVYPIPYSLNSPIRSFVLTKNITSKTIISKTKFKWAFLTPVVWMRNECTIDLFLAISDVQLPGTVKQT